MKPVKLLGASVIALTLVSSADEISIDGGSIADLAAAASAYSRGPWEEAMDAMALLGQEDQIEALTNLIQSLKNSMRPEDVRAWARAAAQLERIKRGTNRDGSPSQ